MEDAPFKPIMHFYHERFFLKTSCSLLDYVIGKLEGVMCFMK
jgi:hypothetical protein